MRHSLPAQSSRRRGVSAGDVLGAHNNNTGARMARRQLSCCGRQQKLAGPVRNNMVTAAAAAGGIRRRLSVAWMALPAGTAQRVALACLFEFSRRQLANTSLNLHLCVTSDVSKLAITRAIS